MKIHRIFPHRDGECPDLSGSERRPFPESGVAGLVVVEADQPSRARGELRQRGIGRGLVRTADGRDVDQPTGLLPAEQRIKLVFDNQDRDTGNQIGDGIQVAAIRSLDVSSLIISYRKWMERVGCEAWTEGAGRV